MAAGNVLAATVTIVFEGLMAFVGPAGAQKTHVAIVNASRHNPEILINGKLVEIEEGDEIVFTDLGAKANTTTDFDKRVPNLKDYLLSGDLHQKVKDKVTGTDRHSGTWAYVALPNGELSPRDYFDHPAQLTKSNKEKEIRCLPRQVLLIRKTSPDTFKMIITGPRRNRPVEIPLNATDSIVIGNTTRHPGNHFDYFRYLLTSNGNIGFVSELTLRSCSDDGDVIGLRDDKVIRPLSPNGDCGPVDYP